MSRFPGWRELPDGSTATLARTRGELSYLVQLRVHVSFGVKCQRHTQKHAHLHPLSKSFSYTQPSGGCVRRILAGDWRLERRTQLGYHCTHYGYRATLRDREPRAFWPDA